MLSLKYAAYSQVSPPDTIAVELISGDAACCFNLPAKFIATSFTGPLTSFTGSNNKLETGSPLYSSQVESGATFYAINEYIVGFPTRIGSNNPPINRYGGSSFIAIKEDDEGNRKTWINISVGAWMISGGVIFNWEYQFRYFEDTKTGTKQATMGTVPNNGGYFGINVVCKVGARFENSELIQGNIKDVVANVTIGSNTYPPLEGANVQLISGSTVYANAVTDKNGYYEIDASNIDKQINYSIRASFGNNEQNKVVVEQANIIVPSVVPDITLPYTLKLDIINAKQKLINVKFETPFLDVPQVVVLPGYDVSGVDHLLSDWGSFEGEYKTTIESMNRTLLAIDMLDKYFHSSSVLPGKFISLCFELMWSLKELNSSTSSLYGGLMAKRNEIKDYLKIADATERVALRNSLVKVLAQMELIKELTTAAVNLIHSYLIKPSIAKISDPDMRDALERLTNFLVIVFEEDSLTKNALAQLFTGVGSPYIAQQYYINQKTQNMLDASISRATYNIFDRSFSDAAYQAHNTYLKTSEDNNLVVAEGENLEQVSKVYDFASNIISNSAELVKLNLDDTKQAQSVFKFTKIFKGFSVLSSGIALTKYAYRYISNIDELAKVNEGAFFPRMLRVSENYNVNNYNINSTELNGLIKQYNDSLSLLKDDVLLQKYVEVAQKNLNLLPVKEAVDVEIKGRVNLMYATLSKAERSESNLKDLANQLISTLGLRETRRGAVNASMLSFLLDEGNLEYKESLAAEIDTFININNELFESIAQYEAAAATFATSPFLAVEQKSFPDSISHSSNFQLKVKYKNYGTEDSGPFNIKVELSNGLSLSSEIYRVENLAGGETDTLSLQVNAGLITKNPYILISFEGVSGFSEPIIFNLSSEIFTKDDVQSQTINFDSISDKTLGDSAFAINAVASSGLPVVFNLVSGPAILEGNVIFLTGEGTVIIRAIQEGNTYYQPTSLERSICILPAMPTITKQLNVLTSSSEVGNQWYLNGNIIEGATAAAYTAMESGSYSVIVIGSCGSSLMSELILYDKEANEKQSQTITFTPISDKTFGDPAFTLSATASSNLPVSFSVVSGSATISGSTLTIIGAGTITVKASQAGNENYDAALDVERSFLVAKANQSINLSDIPSKTIGDEPFQVVVSSTSGLPVILSILSGPASITGNTVTLTGAEGTVTILAQQSGNENYLPAIDLSKAFCVTPIKPIITQVEYVLTSSSVTGNQWYYNGLPIEGATTSTYTADKSGSYSVKVNGICGGTMSDPINITIGTDPGTEDNIIVFPIPAKDVLNIIFPGKIKWTEVKLIDKVGKVWITYRPKNKGNQVKFEVDHLPRGLYVVVITTQTRTFRKTVILK
jgi:hypothetical protein